ncbi:NUDIX pyrophosphatase [Candidatus Bathyarchaeota archaeon]|nr:NUDIX pyrophosphatase [Candidatus Bathyarchaeota archaeon]
MIEKNVVTVFLEHGGKILKVRRSSKVGTYQGKWAGVSGYIEENEEPYQTALKEISEEVGLTAKDVKLIKTGRVLLVPDEENGILWKVHPFLFKSTTREIKIDWEHGEYKWIEPGEIIRYETVPMLKETLENVMK